MRTLIVLLILGTQFLRAQADQSIRIMSGERNPLQDPNDLARIDRARALVYSVADAKGLLDSLKAKGVGGAAFDPTASDFYCLIHLVTWKEDKGETPTDKQLSVKAQNWLVYRSGVWELERFKGKRLFGSKNVWLLSIHLDATLRYTARYDLVYRKLTPAPLENLFALASLIKSSAAGEDAADRDFFSLAKLNIQHLPVEMSAQAVAEADVTREVVGSLGDPVKFVNEGRYRFDFGVAASITRISQLKFDSTNLSATPAKAATATAFGTVNLYPFPVDARTQSFSPYPYLVLGAGIGSQPLQKLLFAAGWGPKFAQFYAGAAVTKDVKPDGKGGFSPQLSIGVSLPVRGFAEMLKEKK